MCEFEVIRGGSAICQFDVSAIMMKILHESFSSPCTWPANSDAFRRTHSLAIWNVDYLLFLTFACCDKYIPCRISAEEAKYARRGLVINKIHNTHTHPHVHKLSRQKRTQIFHLPTWSSSSCFQKVILQVRSSLQPM